MFFKNLINKLTFKDDQKISPSSEQNNIISSLTNINIKENNSSILEGNTVEHDISASPLIEKDKEHKDVVKTTWTRKLQDRLDTVESRVSNIPLKANTIIENSIENLKYSGEAIHFGCTKCGQCCKTPPKVEFEELFKLQNDFIFQTNHTCFLSYNKKPLPKELTDYYNGIGHTIVLTDLEAVLFYFIEFTPIINPSYKQCSKLINNLCSIYENRPKSCQLYPFSKGYEQEEQWRAIKFFQHQTNQNIYACDFSEKAPIIYDDYTFNNYDSEIKFEESITNIHNFTNYYIKFLEAQGGKDYKEQHFKYLVNAVAQQSLFISDTLTPLVVGVLHNLITKEQAENFVRSQLTLIKKEVANSIENKNKENIYTSRLYEKQQKIFEKALLTDMFNADNYNLKETL